MLVITGLKIVPKGWNRPLYRLFLCHFYLEKAILFGLFDHLLF